MFKAVIVCVISVCLLVAVDGGGIETKSSSRSLTETEEPPAKGNHRTSEREQDENYKDNSEAISSEIRSSDESSVNVKQGTSQKDGRDDEIDDIGNLTCGSLPEIEEATSPDLDGDVYPLGTIAKYHCRIGYVSRIPGGFSSFCEINETSGKAEWTEPAISCAARSCGNPGYVPNARRVGNLFTFPNKIEFVCEEGFKLRGVKSRYCEASGRWSGRLPTCDVINCTAPTDPVNGKVSFSSLEYGSELRYTCNRGFILQNDETRVCSADGKWSNNEPECVEARCDKPPSPSRGSVYLSGQPTVGTLAMYSCDEGTTLVGSSTSKCLENGIWTFEPPKCLRSCKIPTVEDGSLGWFKTVRQYQNTYKKFTLFEVGEAVKHDDSAVLSCNQGFTPVSLAEVLSGGTDEVSCNDGEWSKPLQCKTLSCLEDPPPMENGKAQIDSRLHGAVIWYKCNHNLKKLSKGHVECDRGTWKGYTPVCGDDRCHTDHLNYPGLQKPYSGYFASGTTLAIVCEEGFEKTALEETITCLQGKWKIESNPCAIKEAEDHITTEAPSSSSPPDSADICYCIYAYPSNDLVAYTRNKALDPNGKIRKGETITVSCRQPAMYLKWRDSAALSVSVNLRCNSCGNWTRENLPICVTAQGHHLNENAEHRTTTESASTSTTTEATSTTTTTEATSTSTTTEVTSTSSPPACFCTYDYLSHAVAAYVGKKPVNPRDKIKKGETVTLKCRQPLTNLIWGNGLSFYGAVNLTCNPCENWSHDSLPTCTREFQGDSLLLFNNDMKILPGGIIEVPKRKDISFDCINYYGPPRWNPSNKIGTNVGRDVHFIGGGNAYYRQFLKINDATDQHAGTYDCYFWSNGHAFKYTRLVLKIVDYEIQCPELENTGLGIFNIRYENDRKVNSVARYSCKSNSQKLIGESSRTCLANGRWSFSYSTPYCEDIICPYIHLYNGLKVSFTDRRYVNSVATFRCDQNAKLVGGKSLTCMPIGKWSGEKLPTCEKYLNCNLLESSDILKVSYSNGIKIGSMATFSCEPPYTLVGRDRARCRQNGTWNHPLPSCEVSKCSIDALMLLLPEHVFPDMSTVKEDLVPQGTELQFQCEENSILSGSSKTVCGANGRWEHEPVRCIQGCSVDQSSSPHLLIDPLQGHYIFGESVSFSCPPGKKLSSNVQRTMCLGTEWSDPVPGCIEVPPDTENSKNGRATKSG